MVPGGHPSLEPTIRQCESCGAILVLPPEMLSVTCVFCESHLVDAGQDDEPVERVVSFDVDREQAGRRFVRYLASHWLAPESVRRATEPASLRAVLVPFYAFDAETETRFEAHVGIHWWREETITIRQKGQLVEKTRRVRETDWHELSGTHKGQWLGHLVSASRGLSEAETGALAPYDLGRSHPWSPSLVAGIETERPVVDHETAEAQALRGVVERAEAAVAREHLPGDAAREVRCRTRIELGDFRLVLLPVWIAVLPSSYGDLRLLVNGQTGQATGKVPVSWRKVVGLAVVAVLLVLLLVLVGGRS